MEKPKWDLSIFQKADMSTRFLSQQEAVMELINVPDCNAFISTLTYEPDQTGKEHIHGQSRVVFVRKGRITFTLGDKSFETGPGDCFFMLPNTPHSFKVTGDDSPHLVEIVFFKSLDEQKKWENHGEDNFDKT
jgi:quercetin dioxygenase-like cupin family protein